MNRDHKHIATREPKGKVRKPIVIDENHELTPEQWRLVMEHSRAEPVEEPEPFDEATGPMGPIRRADA